MPRLDNPKHERFAQLVAKGMPSSRAYRAAGYSDVNTGNASHLTANDSVASRVAELQDKAAAKALVSVEWVLNGLKQIATDPNAKPGERAKAYELIARHIGMFTERVEHRHSGTVETVNLSKLEPEKFNQLAAILSEARTEKRD